MIAAISNNTPNVRSRTNFKGATLNSMSKEFPDLVVDSKEVPRQMEIKKLQELLADVFNHIGSKQEKDTTIASFQTNNDLFSKRTIDLHLQGDTVSKIVINNRDAREQVEIRDTGQSEEVILFGQVAKLLKGFLKN